MVEWSDEAIVLSVLPYGERECVVSLLTCRYGRRTGLVRGGNTIRMRAVFQAGNVVYARWRSRLAEQLGILSCDLLQANAAYLLADEERLAFLASACAMAKVSLPERVSYEVIFMTLKELVQKLVSGKARVAAAYTRWEMTLLIELGYSLDLKRIVLEARGKPLYVSSRTGQVVLTSTLRGEKLLRLPFFLIKIEEDEVVALSSDISLVDIADALHLTGYFLQHNLSIFLPAARKRLAARFVQSC